MASMVIAEMTPLVPGAGPPPIRIPSLLIIQNNHRSILWRSPEMPKPVEKCPGCQVARLSQFFDPGALGEVGGLKPDHVLSRDSITLACDIDQANPGLACLGLANVAEWNRNHAAALNAD